MNSSWGSNTWGNWGKSGLGSSGSSENPDPYGQHNPSCTAEGTFSNSGGYYDERCTGCRRDRALGQNVWSKPSKSTGTIGSLLKVGTIYGGLKIGKKWPLGD